MRGLRDYLENAAGLGPALDPRRVHVSAKRRGEVRPVVSTPGARIRIARDGWDGEMALLVLFLHRRGVAMELVDGTPAVWIEGVLSNAAAVRAALA